MRQRGPTEGWKGAETDARSSVVGPARPEPAWDSVRENLLELSTGAQNRQAGRKEESCEQDDDQEVMQVAPAA